MRWFSIGRRTLEGRLTILTLVAGLAPSLLLVAGLLLLGVSSYWIGVAAVLLCLLGLYCTGRVWHESHFHFRSLHNLLSAISLGDYTYRGSTKGRSGAYAQLVDSINALGSTLQRQRLQTEESLLLLRKIVDQFDVAIVAWDENEELRLLNPAARKLFGLPPGPERKLSSSPAQVRLPSQLSFTRQMEIHETRVVSLGFDDRRARYRLHLETFIADGKPHRLLFLTDVSQLLRREEKKAWQNLIRVLSHEINNSLTPLASLSEALIGQVARRETDPKLSEELGQGLSIIKKRAESLAAFVSNYRNLAQLPEPQRQVVDLQPLVEGLPRLFPGEEILLEGGSTEAWVDPVQLEQVLINLIKNASEAQRAVAKEEDEEREVIGVSWSSDATRMWIEIRDRGAGIQNLENLFTPFYSTKAGGSGIGLTLCRQIVEAHEGFLSLENRQDGQGCVARVEIPLEEGGALTNSFSE